MFPLLRYQLFRSQLNKIYFCFTRQEKKSWKQKHVNMKTQKNWVPWLKQLKYVWNPDNKLPGIWMYPEFECIRSLGVCNLNRESDDDFMKKFFDQVVLIQNFFLN